MATLQAIIATAGTLENTHDFMQEDFYFSARRQEYIYFLSKEPLKSVESANKYYRCTCITRNVVATTFVDKYRHACFVKCNLFPNSLWLFLKCFVCVVYGCIGSIFDLFVILRILIGYCTWKISNWVTVDSGRENNAFKLNMS